jgi:flagellin-like protein
MFKTNISDNSDKGVSPVVGVILMVAVTVILAAVIGSFVLDLGGNVNQTAQASVTFDEEANGQIDTTDDGSDNPDTQEYKVTVQAVSLGNANQLSVQASNTDNTQTDSESPDSTDNGGSDLTAYDPSVGTTTLSSVGNTSEVTQLTAGDTVTVIGTINDNSNVIQTYTVNE